MKYKGIELNEFTSDKPVVFDPPKRMLVWNDGDNEPATEQVFAFIPNRCYPVIGTDNSFDHCAEIPEESSEQATVLQLAKWVATGNGLLKRGCCITNYVSFDEIDENSPVSDATLVRKWGDKEWHKPTLDYLGLED